MRNLCPVFVAGGAEACGRRIVLENEHETLRGKLDVALANNEDGSLTFFVNMLSDMLAMVEREQARPVHIVRALDPNLVAV